MRTFAALHEVRPLDGCEIDPRTIAGAFVFSFVGARGADEARIRVSSKLTAMHFELVSEHWLTDCEDAIWPEREELCIHPARARASRTGEVVFVCFDVWTTN